MGKRISRNFEQDGVDRRGFLSCMAWAGTGVLYALRGGVAQGRILGREPAQGGGLSFVQISDSHIGFSKEANQNVIGTLEETIARINALPERPAFLVHTGDLTHLSRPDEFDTLEKALQSAKVERAWYLPGEHDVLGDDGKQYRERFGKQTRGMGWFSFDYRNAHFVGLVNVLNLKAGGLGWLGQEQLDWLREDLQGVSSSTPVVVFAHVPLWMLYPEWGWGTDDGMQAMGYLRRFGSVTVLNGHIHQSIQKIEGNMVFHTAASTAFPQPKPGTAPSPGPMRVPAEELRRLLGLTQVSYTEGEHALAIVDSTLGGTAAARQVTIGNFRFAPETVTVKTGTKVTWTNHDDMPHNVVSTDRLFASPVLDTDEAFSYTFGRAGEFGYYCSIHPHMTGKIVARDGESS